MLLLLPPHQQLHHGITFYTLHAAGANVNQRRGASSCKNHNYPNLADVLALGRADGKPFGHGCSPRFSSKFLGGAFKEFAPAGSSRWTTMMKRGTRDFCLTTRARIGGGEEEEYALEQFSADDFSVERLVGTIGFMNVSSYSPRGGGAAGADINEAAGMGREEVFRMAGQQVGQGDIKIRLYRGRIITRGPRLGTRVLLKAYPGIGPSSQVADILAANELATHGYLQEAAAEEEEDRPSRPTETLNHLSILLGGFQIQNGEKWLVFRDDGIITAADYAKLACQATADGASVGEGEFWDRFDPARPIARRHMYIRQVVRGAMKGLAALHSKGRIHQSFGPASVVLNLVEERNVAYVNPRLRDLAFSVNINNPSVLSPTGFPQGPLEEAVESLWQRATREGSTTAVERRTYAIADDIYAAGLFVAFLAFVPLCQPGSIDGPTLQRLFESTFRLDIEAARDYLAADDRWELAVQFLDERNGSGWSLLKAMLNPNYRQRPTAEATLMHPFLQL